MAVESELSVPADLSFEQAIALSQTFLDQWAQNALPPGAIAQFVGDLVGSENGARGFFVTYLTDDRALADAPTPEILQGLERSPEVVAPLLVKNLAMSTAMAIAHQRADNPELAKGSERVQQRTLALLRHVCCLPLPQHLQALRTSIDTGKGVYQIFLEQWGYDAEQKAQIRHILEQTGLL